MVVIREWTEVSAPIVVETFAVKPAASALFPVFDEFRKTLLHCQKEPDESWARFPGVSGVSYDKLSKLRELFAEWQVPIVDKVSTPKTAPIYPRGYVDSKVVICGIAPGYTEDPYYEAAWLLGPSSRTLAKAIQDRLVYFTNVSKQPFVRNVYSESTAAEWLESASREIQAINPSLVIFLGKFDIYASLTLPEAVSVMHVAHPSYINRLQQPGWWFQQLQARLSQHTSGRASWSRSDYEPLVVDGFQIGYRRR